MIRFFSIALGWALSWQAAAAGILPPPPQVAAEAWILIDARTGYVITEHNADLPLPPASLTKLMTSYVLAHELAAGRVGNDDMVLVSENAWAQNPLFAGSSLMWIEVGKTVRLDDLHRGVVVSSGNDATVAIAEHIAGTDDAFAGMMNGHATALGMTNSYFVNSHGLHAVDHYTSARDMAVLAQALIRDFPDAYALYREREFTYNNIRQYNRNTLMAEDSTVDGLKTGYTPEARYCLVASAERRGMRMISVVMGAESEWIRKAESRKLLNHGFRAYETLTLYGAGEKLTTSEVWQGKTESFTLGTASAVHMTIPRGSRDELEAVMEVDQVVRAPVAVGDTFGELVVTLNGDVMLREPLVALEAVEPAAFWRRFRHGVVLFFSRLFGG